jgi:hypothetical protein
MDVSICFLGSGWSGATFSRDPFTTFCQGIQHGAFDHPEDLTITPRDRRFGRGLKQDRWWMGGDPVATAFYNALSATFPKGEAFFVESVRNFREGTPPKLAAEIRAFVTQEVMHSREHVQFNKRALEAGYDMSTLEKRVESRLSMTRDQAADRQPRRDHVPRAFHRDPRPSIAQQSAPSRQGRSGERRAVALARDRGDRA